MKFQVMSDLHREFYPVFEDNLESMVNWKADGLILAGDIVTPNTISRLKSFKSKIPIYYVLGNHEFYNGSWDYSIGIYQEYLKDANIHVLENKSTVVPEKNIRIIGSTLWTDFWAPGFVGRECHLAACVRGMNDFHLIKGLMANKWEERHKESLRFIIQSLSEKHDGPTIVMTHHAPSFKSNHPIYKNSPISGGFCSDLEYIIEEYQPNYWIHGHCHESFDYKIGNTRVICNPMGYPGALNPDFNQNLIIEV